MEKNKPGAGSFWRRVCFLGIVVFALFAAALVIPGLLTAPRIEDEVGADLAEIPVYVLDNGAHTDLALPGVNEFWDWTGAFPEPDSLAGRPGPLLVIFGWGQREFYLRTKNWADIKPGLLWNSLWGAPAALHVDYARGILKEGPDCRKLLLTKAQYRRLCAFILRHAQTGGRGKPLRIDSPGYGESDAFYEAKGSFSLLNTCNTWTARALRRAGQKSPLWTIFPCFVMYHLPGNSTH